MASSSLYPLPSSLFPLPLPSYHSLIKWSTDLRWPPPIYITETRRSWENFLVEKFRSALQKSPLSNMDLQKSLDTFQLACIYDNVIARIMDKLVSLRKVTVRKRPSDSSNRWFDHVCLEQKKRARLHSHWSGHINASYIKAWRDSTVSPHFKHQTLWILAM